MRGIMLKSAVAAGTLALLASMPAAQAAPGATGDQAAVADAVAAASDTVAVKGGRGHGHGHGWGHRHRGAPPGWSRGRKVGWGGGWGAPGRRKKGWR